jgi:short repeat uncharacterized protein DUF308
VSARSLARSRYTVLARSSGALLLGLLSVAAGIFMIFNPLAGAAALTLVVGVIFVFQGAFDLFFAFEMRPPPGWAGMLISGIASIVMAVLIAAGWPAISMVVLGILLGVNFLSTGFGYIFVSRALKSAASSFLAPFFDAPRCLLPSEALEYQNIRMECCLRSPCRARRLARGCEIECFSERSGLRRCEPIRHCLAARPMEHHPATRGKLVRQGNVAWVHGVLI